MSMFSRLGRTTAIALILTASAAKADLTATQVWSDWQDYMQSFGYDVTANVQSVSGEVTVSDLLVGMEMAEEDAEVAMNISELRFIENGDGTVRVEFPSEFPMTFAAPTDDGGRMNGTMIFSQSGLSLVASGEPEVVNYAYSAASMGVTMEEAIVDGTTLEDLDVNVALTNVTGSSTSEMAELRTIAQTMSIGTLTYGISGRDPESDDTINMDGSVNAVSFSGTAALPLEMDPENIDQMLTDGFAFDGTFQSQGGNTNISGTDQGQPIQMSTASESGTARVAMDAGTLRYELGATGTSFQIAGGDVPIPIDVQMASTVMNFLVPLAQSEEPQDFAMTLTLGDFVMSDMIWSLFDPTQILPRDPATVSIDVSGETTLKVNLTDEDQMAALDSNGGVPGELNSMSLNGLLVSLAGARLTGSGDFTFDNSDLATFDGMPAPDGAVELQLTGGNGLLDKLVQMGLLPEDQAMGARMMMGLFAVPGQGEDVLDSRIEVKPDGQILANGQRIR